MYTLLKRVTGILYPRNCPVCGRIVSGQGELICSGCEKHIQPLREPLCKKCGKPLAKEEREECYDCEKTPHLFERGAALLAYEGKVKESVYRMKFHNKREYLDYYGAKMADELEKNVRRWQTDFMVPVPMHWRKKRERGFNQAEILAKKMAEGLNLPVRNDLVVRSRYTRPQKELFLRERKENLRGAFEVRKNEVTNQTIILVDDIYTTGTTIDEIAGELKHAGARCVYFLTLCIGREDC